MRFRFWKAWLDRSQVWVLESLTALVYRFSKLDHGRVQVIETRLRSDSVSGNATAVRLGFWKCDRGHVWDSETPRLC